MFRPVLCLSEIRMMAVVAENTYLLDFYVFVFLPQPDSILTYFIRTFCILYQSPHEKVRLSGAIPDSSWCTVY